MEPEQPPQQQPPPQQPPPQQPPQRPPMGIPMNVPGTLPVPGNAEFALYVVILLLFAILWAATESVNAGNFATLTMVITAAYLLSRGIAKASRVYEH
jgi:hypothetical protein